MSCHHTVIIQDLVVAQFDPWTILRMLLYCDGCQKDAAMRHWNAHWQVYSRTDDSSAPLQSQFRHFYEQRVKLLTIVTTFDPYRIHRKPEETRLVLPAGNTDSCIAPLFHAIAGRRIHSAVEKPHRTAMWWKALTTC